MMFHSLSVPSMCWVIVHPIFSFDRHYQSSALFRSFCMIGRLIILLLVSLECGLAALPSHAASLPWPGSLQDDKMSLSNHHGNAGLVPGLHVLGETEKLQERRRFSAVTSTPPEPGMNPREGDLLEVVYWKALVISWHLRLSFQTHLTA